MSNTIRLIRYFVPGQSSRLGVCNEDVVSEFSPLISSFEELVTLANGKNLFKFVHDLKTVTTSYHYHDLNCAHDKNKPHLLIPLVPVEAWGAGVTYERSRVARGEEEEVASGIYDKVYSAARPELFFKATSHRCVGPNQHCGIRSDSKWTVPEPELCVVVGANGEILAYSLGNDMNARDIEGENPLYLPQAKIHKACFSFGPSLLLVDSAEPPHFPIICRIMRDKKQVFCGETNTSQFHRPISEMISYLRRMDVPALTVLTTGTGIVPPTDFWLHEGDVIEIESEKIGVLRNTVMKV